jgi:type IV pilus assembly protein PilA
MPGQPYPPGYGHRPPPKSGMPTWAIVLIVLLVVMIVGAGMVAAIAIPAFTKYMRRSKTAEARVNLAKMFDAASAYHAETGQCPTDGSAQGSAGATPPLTVHCGEGPGGRCVPNGAGGGAYSLSAWTEHPVWQKMNFQQEAGHYYHYDFRWGADERGCMFTAQAFGDLDDDGVFSTFERSGAANDLGVNASAGLYIDNEIE